MDCDKKCPLKSRGKCTKEKCEFWVTEVIEARPEQCTKILFAKDFMSPADYTDLVRLSLLAEKVQTALNDTTLTLGQLGKASIFRPMKSKKIHEKENELKRLTEHLKSIESFRTAIFARYEKTRKNLAAGLLKKSGFYSQTYESYNSGTLSWEIGGVRLGEDQHFSRCILTESAMEVKEYLNNKALESKRSFDISELN